MTDRSNTQRVTVRIPEGLLEQIEDRVERGEDRTRNDAIRAGLRRLSMDHAHVGTER